MLVERQTIPEFGLGVVGSAYSYGAYVFISNLQIGCDSPPVINCHLVLPTVAAHEVTHNLLNEDNTNGFVNGEHDHDGDESDPPNSQSDMTYLMHSFTTPVNRTRILFLIA